MSAANVRSGCDTGCVLDLRLLVNRAADLGHRGDIERRDFPDGVQPKFYITCSCGYAARVRRTEKSAIDALVFHLGKAVGEHGGIREVNGVSSPRRSARSGSLSNAG